MRGGDRRWRGCPDSSSPTADPKAGAVGGAIDLFGESVVNHRPAVESGLLAGEAAALLEAFFAARR